MSWKDRIKKVIGDIDGMSKNESFPIHNEDLEQSQESSPPPEQDYFSDVIMPLVLIEEQKIRDTQGELLDLFIHDHEQQVKHFDFSCVRHGDFLAIFITRNYNDHYSKMFNPKPETKFATTINLSLVTTITKIDGHSPNLTGTVRYHASQVADGNESSFLSSDGSLHKPAPKGYHHQVRPYNWPLMLYPKLFIYTSSEVYPSSYRSRGILGHTTEHTPIPSKDDVVRLSGIDINIFAPFGLGDSVHTKILEALEKGYTPKGIMTDLK